MKVTFDEFLNEVIIRRRAIIISLLGVFICSFMYILVKPSVFQVTVKLIPRVSESGGLNMSGLGGIASLAGINVGSNKVGDVIPPNIYPEILSSSPFSLEVMKLGIITKNGELKSFEEFYFHDIQELTINKIKKYTLGLPSLLTPSNDVQMASNDSQMLGSFDLSQYEVMEYLKSKLSLTVSKEDGIVSLSFSTIDPYVAKQLTENAIFVLKSRIKEYKLEKLNSELLFLDSLYQAKRLSYEKAQVSLADFRDRNANLSTSRSKIEEDRLEKEFNLEYDLLSEISKEYEGAKITYKKEEPSFMMLEPAFLPLEPTGSGRLLTLIMISTVGVIVILILIGVKLVLERIKENYL